MMQQQTHSTMEPVAVAFVVTLLDSVRVIAEVAAEDKVMLTVTMN